MCVASPYHVNHKVVCVSGKKQAVTSSLEQRAQLIAVKYANDEPSNDFIGIADIAENALTKDTLTPSYTTTRKGAMVCWCHEEQRKIALV